MSSSSSLSQSTLWRAKFVLAYDGSPFRGSQVQSAVPTVQASFEAALEKIRALEGRTAFAGRTDAGVHAAGQVVSCDVRWSREPHSLAHALNGNLPREIRVLRCDRVSQRFHARFDAISREYRYRIAEKRTLPPQFTGMVWCRDWTLDEDRARSAVQVFVGRHQFGSFASAGISQRDAGSDLERTILGCSWHLVGTPLIPLPPGRRIHELRIRADGFLPQMVRNIVSAVVEVATGNQSQEWLEYLLVSGDRRLLGPPAPPHGLVLWDVEYPAGLDVESESKG